MKILFVKFAYSIGSFILSFQIEVKYSSSALETSFSFPNSKSPKSTLEFFNKGISL